jgi:hypothetical protein
MAGYLLIHRSQFKPYKANGFEPHPNRLGALDYLRELRQTPFPFPEGYRLLVEGMDDLLVAAGPNFMDVARFLHDSIAARANDLNRMGTNVQVLFNYPIRFGAECWIEIGMDRLALTPVFGMVEHRYDDRTGVEYFVAGFNLS